MSLSRRSIWRIDTRSWNSYGIVQQALAIPMLYVTHSPAEALALGSRLFLLEAGRIVAEGSPLEALSTNEQRSPGSNTWEDVRNVFTPRSENRPR